MEGSFQLQQSIPGLITLSASDLQALTGLNLVGFSCQQWMHCDFVFWIRKCFMACGGTTGCDPACGSWEAGRVYPWVILYHLRGCLGEQQDHAGNLLGFLMCLYLLKDYPESDLCAHIRELRSETQELLCKRCSSLCPAPVLSHHRSADSSFAPTTFWSPLPIAEVYPLHPCGS